MWTHGNALAHRDENLGSGYAELGNSNLNVPQDIALIEKPIAKIEQEVHAT